MTTEARTEFSDETIVSLKELGVVLQEIHNRLISEGYVIKDGKIEKPKDEHRKEG